MPNSEYQNSLLGIAAKAIPYIKHLRPITGSVTGAILWQQLEYWFNITKGKAFYKYLVPLEAERDGYRRDDSWAEELAFSEFEFNSAFDKIGTRHKSKKLYKSAVQSGNEFGEKMYCSWKDNRTGKTWYCRNHGLVEEQIKMLIAANEDCSFAEMKKPCNPTNSACTSEESKGQQNDDVKGHTATDTTTDSTAETTTTNDVVVNLEQIKGFRESKFALITNDQYQTLLEKYKPDQICKSVDILIYSYRKDPDKIDDANELLRGRLAEGGAKPSAGYVSLEDRKAASEKNKAYDANAEIRRQTIWQAEQRSRGESV